MSVDPLGLILTALVHPADIPHRIGAMSTVAQLGLGFSRLKMIWADGGYAGQFVDLAKRRCGRVVEIAKRSAASQFVVLPKRSIVERASACFGKYRRLSKDHETLMQSSETMIHTAMINVVIHRICTG